MIKCVKISFVMMMLSFCAVNVQALTLKEILSPAKGEKVVPQKELPQAEGVAMAAVNQEGDTPFVTQFFKGDVEAKIQKELQKQYGDNIEVVFASWILPKRHVAPLTQFIVEEIEVNAQRTKVAALVHFQISGQLTTLKVRGRLTYMIEVPTVNRPIHHGELITKDDIAWTKVSERKSNRFLITKAEGLIGRQPRGGFLKVGMPLYQRDVEYVRDVEKGSMVTAHYKTARLELVTKVRALAHGHKGETIRILNPDTNKILYGVVVGPNSVSLSPETMKG